MNKPFIPLLVTFLLLSTSFIGVSIPPQNITSHTQKMEQTKAPNGGDILDYYRNYRYRAQWRMEEAYNIIPDEKGDSIGPISMNFRNDYTPHNPISINGDTDFTEANGVTGGNGTVEDPYIIEGWEITAQGTAIDIAFTTAYFIIRYCSLKDGTVSFYAIERGAVDNIIISDNVDIGFYIDGSSNITITNSTVAAALCIKLFDSSHHVSISNCTFQGDGVYLDRSSFIVLSNLSIKNGYMGIVSAVTNNITILGCDVFSNTFGIALYGCEHGVLRNNILYNNTYNFDIGGGFDTFDIDMSNTINGKPIYYLHNQSNLVFDGNENIGFFALINCQNMTVKNFITNSNAFGIVFAGTTDSIITSSTFNDGGYLFQSSNNLIDHCTFNGQGIWMDFSPYNSLRNNSVIGGDFSVWGTEIKDFYQDIDLTNTRNGRPIYYLVEQDNRKFDRLDCGYLGLVSCDNIKLSNIEMNDNWEGLLLVNSSGTVRQCSFSNDFFGIEIVHSTSRLTISRCTFNGNEDGFHIIRSSNISIKRCTIKSNGWYGLYIENSSNNIIRWCTINNGVAGIRCITSWDNQIDFNTITSSINEAVGIWYGGWGNKISFNTIILCSQGVRLMYGAQGNEVHFNTMVGNDFWGVEMEESNNNNVTYNNIKQAKICGVRVGDSNGNTIDHNNIVGNDQGAIVVDCTANLTNNWWGSSSGPGGIGPGSGDSIMVVNATVHYDPWLVTPVKIKLHGLLYIIMSIFKIK